SGYCITEAKVCLEETTTFFGRNNRLTYIKRSSCKVRKVISITFDFTINYRNAGSPFLFLITYLHSVANCRNEAKAEIKLKVMHITFVRIVHH
ncbi:hypothetical protein, partial [Sphingobacterium sp. UBA3549]|uniref:hypothetical protein n=1 Tax=Sphingobacterium sp. UBA3549 TaxID=1947496 RepID=UPI0025EC2324